MPDIKVVIPAVIAVAFLVFLAAGLDWIIAHPTVLIFGVIVIGGLIFLVARRSYHRNRV